MSTADAPNRPGITVLYGTETGNSMRVSKRLQQRLQAAGLRSRWLNTGAYSPLQLPQERCLLVVISTYDDGEPPDDARSFMEFLTSPHASRLPLLSYAVLALGASCYAAFCTVGRLLDARLAELGATRLLEVGLCDTDFEATAAAWITRATQLVRAKFGTV